MSGSVIVSSYAQFLQTTSLLRANQTTLSDLQRQMATGKKTENLADYGADARRLLDLRQEVERREAYMLGIDSVQPRLKMYDTALTKLEDIAKELHQAVMTASGNSPAKAKAGANGTLTLEAIDGNAAFVVKGSKLVSAPPSVASQTAVAQQTRVILTGGTVSGVAYSVTVDGQPFVHVGQNNESLADVATALATQINTAFPAVPGFPDFATVSGNTLTLAARSTGGGVPEAGVPFTVTTSTTGPGIVDNHAIIDQLVVNRPAVAQQSAVHLRGTVEEGDSYSFTINGSSWRYVVQGTEGETVQDVVKAIAGAMNGVPTTPPFSTHPGGSLPALHGVVATADGEAITFVTQAAGTPFTIAAAAGNAPSPQSQGFALSGPMPQAGVTFSFTVTTGHPAVHDTFSYTTTGTESSPEDLATAIANAAPNGASWASGGAPAGLSVGADGDRVVFSHTGTSLGTSLSVAASVNGSNTHFATADREATRADNTATLLAAQAPPTLPVAQQSTVTLAGQPLDAGEVLSVKIDGKTLTYTATGREPDFSLVTQSLADRINRDPNLPVTAATDAGGVLTLTAKEPGKAFTLVTGVTNLVGGRATTTVTPATSVVNVPAARQQQTVALDGAVGIAGYVYSVEVNGVSYSYTTSGKETSLDEIAQNLARQINADALEPFELHDLAKNALANVEYYLNQKDTDRYLFSGSRFGLPPMRSLNPNHLPVGGNRNTVTVSEAGSNGAVAKTLLGDNFTDSGITTAVEALDITFSNDLPDQGDRFMVSIGGQSFTYTATGLGEDATSIAADFKARIEDSLPITVNQTGGTLTLTGPLPLTSNWGTVTPPANPDAWISNTVDPGAFGPIAGTVYTTTVGKSAFSYTAQAGDVAADVVQNMVGQINGSGLPVRASVVAGALQVDLEPVTVNATVANAAPPTPDDIVAADELPHQDTEGTWPPSARSRSAAAWSKEYFAAADDRVVHYGIPANHEAFQNLVMALRQVDAAARNSGNFQNAMTEARALVEEALTGLRSLQTQVAINDKTLSDVRGEHQQFIDLAKTHVAGIEQIDEAEVAARLLAAKTRTEATYAATAMIKQLSLVNYVA